MYDYIEYLVRNKFECLKIFWWLQFKSSWLTLWFTLEWNLLYVVFNQIGRGTAAPSSPSSYWCHFLCERRTQTGNRWCQNRNGTSWSNRSGESSGKTTIFWRNLRSCISVWEVRKDLTVIIFILSHDRHMREHSVQKYFSLAKWPIFRNLPIFRISIVYLDLMYK